MKNGKDLGLIFLVVLGQLYSCLSQGTVYVYDLSYIESLDPQDSYENSHIVTAIQGLVNRDAERLYVLLTPSDYQWLQYLKSNWLKGRQFINITSVEELVTRFHSYFNGVVLYDPNVWSTSLVASTVAGVENLLPICKREVDGSLYNRLVLNGPKLQVQVSLVDRFNGSVTGSKKCDAYIWAKENYLDTGKCNAAAMGYYLDYYWTTVAKQVKLPYDVNTVTNQDYFIAKKGFMWDLDVWGDDEPNDDPQQPLGTDLKTLQAILLSAYKQTKGNKMIHIGGFTPWAFKYVNAKHGGVPTEWQTVEITTAYNAYLDADACCVQAMANAAFYQHFPLAAHYTQNPPPTRDDLVKKGYLTPDGKVVPQTYFMFYVGDYDSAAWLYSQLKNNWDDPKRGSVPLGWAVDPNLKLRFPVIFDYMFKSLTPLDRIITGDSGAGYINPTQLFVPRKFSGLPAATELWRNHSVPFYQQFDMSFTGFLINGASGHMTKAAEQLYAAFSKDGMVEQYGYSPTGGVHLTDNAPVFEEIDLPDDPAQAAQTILSRYKEGTHFQVYRSVLKSPSYHAAVVDTLQQHNSHIVAVEPLVLSALAKIQLTKA